MSLLPIAVRHTPETAARIEDADRILGAALAAVNPRTAVRTALSLEGDTLRAGERTFDLATFDRVLVVGGGKAGSAMTEGVIDVLGRRVTAGVVVVKDGHRGSLDDARIDLREASHPWPDARGVAGTEAMAALLDETTARDLVVVVVSGGASALLELPPPGVTLEDLRSLTDALLRSGATIDEMNTVRKHVSSIKGGQLAARAAPATVLSLALVDVVGAPLDVVASGPTVADRSTFADALAVLSRHRLNEAVPHSIHDHLERGRSGAIPETPKPGDPRVAAVTNIVVADIARAAGAAEREASALGYDAALLTTFLEGEARDVAKVVCAIAREIATHDRPRRAPAALVFGGETTVTIRGDGRGGRNQELALAAAIELRGRERVLVVSLATDGTDGPTDAAGGLATGTSFDEGRALGLDPHAYLERNDAYAYLRATGDLVITGPTGTNVCDLVLVLVW